MDVDVDKALQELASKEKASVNSVVNKVLRKFVEWDAQALRFGFITITVPELKKLFGFLSEQEVQEYGHWFGENLAREYVTFFFKRVDYDTVMRALEMLGSDYGGHYQFEDHFDGRVHTVICKHGRGQKWSLFYEEAFKVAFKNLLDKDVELERTDDQVTIRIIPEARDQVLMESTARMPRLEVAGSDLIRQA